MLDNNKIDDTFKEYEGKRNRLVAQQNVYSRTCDSGKVELRLRKDLCAQKAIGYLLYLILYCYVS